MCNDIWSEKTTGQRFNNISLLYYNELYIIIFLTQKHYKIVKPTMRFKKLKYYIAVLEMTMKSFSR